MYAERCLKILLFSWLAVSISCSGPAERTAGSIETEHLKLDWAGEKVTVVPLAGGKSWHFDLSRGVRAVAAPPGYYAVDWSIDFGFEEQPAWDSPGPELQFVERQGKNILRYWYNLRGTHFSVSFRLLFDAPELEVTVEADTLGELVVTDIEAPGGCRPDGGEISTFLMPQMQGIIWRRDLEASFLQHFRTNKRVVGLQMPFYLVRSGDDWMMCVYRTPDDAAVTIYKDRGAEPVLTPRFFRSLKTLRYPRRLVYRFEHGSGYSRLCKVYRDRYVKPDGNFKTFAEKAAERPVLDKALGAPYVFIGVGNQKPDTIMAALDTLKAMGYEQALVVSISYYNPGEEGTKAFIPGTINEYPALAEPIRAMGYLPVGWLLVNHYTRDCPGYDPHRAARAGDGTIIKCWRIGEKLEWQALLPDLILPAMRETEREWIFPDAFHFDTGASSGLYEMFSTDGRVFTRTDDKMYRTEYFKYLTGRGKVNLSEGAQTWCVPYLDVGSVNGLGAWLEEGFHYDLVPLWHLVFHECVQGMWHEGATYQAGDFEKKFLCDISWGCPPTISPLLSTYSYNARDAKSALVPFSHNILRPEDSAYKEQIRRSVEVYRFARKVAGAEMTGHSFLDDERLVARSEFAGGYVAYVNFGEREFSLPDGRRLGGRSYLIDER